MKTTSYAAGVLALAGSAVARPQPPHFGRQTQVAGVNIAGFDFGCDITGTCTPDGYYPPLGTGYYPNGPGQMEHFVKDDHLNIFRLPIGWQYLVNFDLGGPLNSTIFAEYDGLMQSCLKTGAYCILDVHNYARWNNTIIGQGGPTNEQFASLWIQLAEHYRNNRQVIFGIMNEPHDLDVAIWAETVQYVVTAIRHTGAEQNIISLPGTSYTSAELFVSDGSFGNLSTVVNPGGGYENLIFDVHKYLDVDNSGTHAECVTNNINSTFAPLAATLRQHHRMAILSETGGGNVASCVQDLCQEIAFLNDNSDVYFGYVGWAAGSFDDTYVLDETPVQNANGSWTDTLLVSSCIAR